MFDNVKVLLFNLGGACNLVGSLSSYPTPVTHHNLCQKCFAGLVSVLEILKNPSACISASTVHRDRSFDAERAVSMVTMLQAWDQYCKTIFAIIELP